WESAPNTKLILMQFNLGVENVVASWYSSMFLLSISVVCLVCWFSDRAGQLRSPQDKEKKRSDSSPRRFFSLGWLCLAALFMGLSLDELGSVHERLGELFPVQRDGIDLGWEHLLLIPILAVAGLMLGFAWLHLRRRPATVALMILGTALFVSIPFQERFEQNAWRETGKDVLWQRPMRYVLLEEGSELFGMLCFFAAAAMYLANRESGGLQVRVTHKQAAFGSLWLSAAVIGGCFAATYLSSLRPDPSHGIAQNWFPSFLAMLAAFLAWQRAMMAGNARLRQLLWMTSAGLIAISAYFGANLHNYRFWLGHDPTWQALHGIAGAMILSLGMLLSWRVPDRPLKPWPILGASLLAWSLVAAAVWIELIAAVGLALLGMGLFLGIGAVEAFEIVLGRMKRLTMSNRSVSPK
ncbi:MAG: hypothetical protein ACK4UN_15175, partial [Limisphaerales bacterium]